MGFLKNDQEYQDLKRSSLILVSCISLLRKTIKPGMNAKELDDLAYQFIKDHGGEPAFLGYDGFEYTVCTSINDEVAHGLSHEEKIFEDGSLVNLDVGVVVNGMHSDSGYTIGLGDISKESQFLIDGTKEALQAGISVVKSGVKTGTIGAAVDAVAKKYGLGNVYELGGHGVGHAVHEEPYIANQGKVGKGSTLFENQVIAIEPMFTLGAGDVEFDTTDEDGWTVRTADGSRCAQYEHTVLIRKKGAEVLTDIDESELLT
jgi:methionyl aminopeptidase